MKTFKELSEKLKKDKDDPCWKGYVQLGTKKKNGKEVPNCVPKEEKEIEEKAVSKAQQRFMGMVRAKQKGEMPDASPEVSKAAASMSKKDVKDFAKTKHKGLPNKVDEGPDYLGDLRRKKEREERKRASQHAGETDRQKTMRKVYGKAMGGLKKGYGESVEAGIVEGTDTATYMWKDINAALSSAGINPSTIARVLSNLKGKSTK